MKKFQKEVWKIFFILFVNFSISYAQGDACLTNMTQNYNEPPAYLSPGWGQAKQIQVAIVYFDFPDGRYNGQQPTETSQLSGMTPLQRDAAAEVGLTFNSQGIPVSTTDGLRYINAAKYERHDRWKMFFLEKTPTIQGYTGNAHPDYATHHSISECRDEAFGSMVDYWKEVSNNKITIAPAITHPLETDNELKTGIVNRYMDVGGRKIIKYLTLQKNKYDSPSGQGYFDDYETLNGFDFDVLLADMESRLTQAYNSQEIDFNVNTFRSAGGQLIYIFAGSHQAFKGTTELGTACIVRGMNDRPETQYCRIDGITNMMHEFGHLAFEWPHTISGRNDLMNVHNTKDINCPTHPNPILKLREGWLDVVPLENSQSAELPPIETSGKCGIITIYGKPSAAPDHLSGECFIVENRKRIGFDRELLSRFNSNDNGFNGGLLIWHYSPYTLFNYSTDCGGFFDRNIKFIQASLSPPIECGVFSPLYFFAHTDNPQLGPITSLTEQRTYSAENFKTGIRLTNIAQTNYSDVTSSIRFNLEYTISEPPQYDYVIFPRNFGHVTDQLGKIFFHKADENANFILHEGASLEAVAQGIQLAPFKTRTRVDNPIVFKAAGYENSNESYITRFSGITTGPHYFDSLVAENIKIKNVTTNNHVLVINRNYGNNLFPINKIKNIIFEDCIRPFYDVKINDNYYSDIDLSDCSILLNSCNIRNQLKTFNCNLYFYGDIKFSPNGLPVDCILTNVTNKLIEFNSYIPATLSSNTYWSGINLTSSNIDIKNVGINNALIGIQSEYPSYFKVNNCVFNNSIGHGIILSSFHPINSDICEINNNQFNCNPDFSYSAISCNDDEKVNILNNEINTIGQFGITLINCPDAIVNENTITGANSNDGPSTGILSYTSGGSYNCNTITDCQQYGMLLDNSQPVLYSNVIENNGIGLFLTHNSHPLMTPGYTINQTYEIGGLNRIKNSAGPEIYCDNDKNFNCTPEMRSGKNIIEDDLHSPDTLIFNSDISVTPPTIRCEDNGWGGGDPLGRLVPDYSFDYLPYLGAFEPIPCGFGVFSENNSGMSQSELLLGNYMSARHQNNNQAALGYAYDLYNLQSSDISQIVPLNNIFYTSLINNSNLATLESFYAGIESSSLDTIISKRARDLKIETKVEEELLTPALNDYDNIVNTSNDEKEIFYANLNKSRVNRLILDSLLAHFHSGDNYDNTTLNNLVNETIVKSIRSMNRMKSDDNSVTTNVFLNKLNSEINLQLSRIDELSNREKKNLLLKNVLVQLAINSYNPNIGSIQRGVLNKLTNTSIVAKYELAQNYPNPFNPITNIKYSLPKAGFVSIKVYDVVGRMVKELVNEIKETGNYSVMFDGSQFSSGVYFYRIETNNFVDTKRMVLVK